MRQLEDVVEQAALLAGQAAGARGGEQQPQLLLVVLELLLAHRVDPDHAEDGVGGVVEDVDRRVGDLVEEVERQRHPEAGAARQVRPVPVVELDREVVGDVAVERAVAHGPAHRAVLVGVEDHEGVGDHHCQLHPDGPVGGDLRVRRDVVAVGGDGGRQQREDEPDGDGP